MSAEIPFAQRLRSARLAAGLTHDKVAEVLGCAQATVSRWESGDRTPVLADLPAIARAVNANLADLLGLGAMDDHTYAAGYREGWRACADVVSAAIVANRLAEVPEW